MTITGSDKLLMHMPGPPPKGFLKSLAARFPELEVRWEIARFDPASSDLDAADGLPSEVLDGVTLLCAYPPPRPDCIERVRFVQLISAGSDRWADHAWYRDPKVIFCSGSGCHAGIFGYGAIGRQCAHLAKALGMDVSAYTQHPRLDAASRRHNGYSVPGTGDPDGLIPSTWFHGDPRIVVDEFLAQDLDILVLALPLSDSTRRLIGPAQFKRMSRRRTFLCNISRGPIVDTGALVDALNAGTISGAALDVTDPEPLPKPHPLWKAPNVFITPHISWQSSGVVARVASLMMENLERLDKGEPLINRINQ
ncbi:hypothetical protein DCS_04872 [Drechmeria coniospora]|uniref:D-isomer specific 2-hydroxyacid dehydrogenase NAD-binding domain-containing protein n=1 Tax=Drechmeria coniospora TaxID=98403 RepID=A0A151GL84_DRECN|nr:hypothetical protein DCS_04872 [Drechmeria coniospora]KYK57859.1 hypothetical protein DCS_04872 [Drechmeria coniospora]